VSIDRDSEVEPLLSGKDADALSFKEADYFA
jgi:hypothetical protein